MSLPITYFPVAYDGFSLAYNSKTKTPDCVFESHNGPIVKNVSRTNMTFKQDRKIPLQFQSTAEDFKYSGYDKGHFAPAANHAGSLQAMQDTFVYTNVGPMNPSLNRGYWRKLETFVRDLTHSYQVKIITGSLYLPNVKENGERYAKIRIIGKSNVWVPTDFFKVLIIKDRNNKEKVKSYIIPNKPISSTIPLGNFETSIEKVERASGCILSEITEQAGPNAKKIKGQMTTFSQSERNLLAEFFKSKINHSSMSHSDLADEVNEIIDEIS